MQGRIVKLGQGSEARRLRKVFLKKCIYFCKKPCIYTKPCYSVINLMRRH